MICDDRNKCARLDCDTRATFGDPVTGRRTFCGKHAPQGTVNIERRKCAVEDCLTLPAYWHPGNRKRRCCAKHAEDGMVKLDKKLCPFEGCFTSASYGVVGQKRKYCAAHAERGMVSIGGRRCAKEGCSKRANYGVAGTNKREFCAGHAAKGMVNINNQSSGRRKMAPTSGVGGEGGVGIGRAGRHQQQPQHPEGVDLAGRPNSVGSSVSSGMGEWGDSRHDAAGDWPVDQHHPGSIGVAGDGPRLRHTANRDSTRNFPAGYPFHGEKEMRVGGGPAHMMGGEEEAAHQLLPRQYQQQRQQHHLQQQLDRHRLNQRRQHQQQRWRGTHEWGTLPPAPPELYRLPQLGKAVPHDVGVPEPATPSPRPPSPPPPPPRNTSVSDDTPSLEQQHTDADSSSRLEPPIAKSEPVEAPSPERPAGQRGDEVDDKGAGAGVDGSEMAGGRKPPGSPAVGGTDAEEDAGAAAFVLRRPRILLPWAARKEGLPPPLLLTNKGWTEWEWQPVTMNIPA
ncbi:unnamed protein product [Ectocarpus sp. CCAP 1310/34]|nr:unnamed protein product [Ectocarpus sp. CCAP 1310/34]